MPPPPAPHHWLLRWPYRTRGWAAVLRAGRWSLTGLRSPAARAALTQVQPPDEFLFYHQQQIWGIVQALTPAYPDPTAPPDSNWLALDLEPIRALPAPILLIQLRTLPALANHPALTAPRLALVPLAAEQFNDIVSRSQTP